MIVSPALSLIQWLAAPAVCRITIAGTRVLGLQRVLAYGTLPMHLGMCLIVRPYSGDDVIWRFLFLDPSHEGKYHVMFGITEAWHSRDTCTEARGLICASDIPRGVHGGGCGHAVAVMTIHMSVNLKMRDDIQRGLESKMRCAEINHLLHARDQEHAVEIVHLSTLRHDRLSNVFIKVDAAARGQRSVRKAVVVYV